MTDDRRTPYCLHEERSSVDWRPSRMAIGFEISLTFDEFGWSTLDDHARAEGLELDQLLALACSYYASELGGERMALRVPRFEEGSEQETRTFVLELSSEALEQLEGEAKRQEIRLDRLFEHAAMLYIADLDAGRVAKRITERTDL
jgi:hypothetical protein